jgi:hypothetical protein
MNPINNNSVINNATVDGNNVAYMQNANPGTAIIYQDIGNVSQSGNYTLALLVGNRKDLTTGTPAITLATGSSFGTGGSGLTPPTPTSTTTPALVNDAGNMVQWTMSYSVSASTHVWIELADSGINNWVAFDNVQLYGGSPSTNTITSSQNPSLTGGAVTVTATVTGSGATPTGKVVFMDGTNTLGNGTLNASGVANLSTAALSLGKHSITALYGGDSTFGGSASSTLSQTVSGPNTLTISNPGFEANVSNSGRTYYGSYAPNNWNVYLNSQANPVAFGSYSPGSAQLSGIVGNNVVFIYNGGVPSLTRTLYQDIGSVAQSGNYRLTLLVGEDTYGSSGGSPTIVLAMEASGSTPGSGLTALTASSSSTPSVPHGSMVTWTFDYTISSGTDVFIELANNTSSSSLDYDNLSLVGGTPTTNTLISSSNPSVNGSSVTFTATVNNPTATFSVIATFSTP